MTVIVAARTTDGGVTIAADSLTSRGWEKVHNDRTKVWTSDQFCFGGAGCVRSSQVIQHFTDWPRFRPDEDSDIEGFLVRRVWPAMVAASGEQGSLTTNDGVQRIDSELVIAWGTHLATVRGNGAVIRPAHGRLAVGSGYAEALGALGEAGPWKTKDVIEAARRATITAHGCEGHIRYVTTKDRQVTEANI